MEGGPAEHTEYRIHPLGDLVVRPADVMNRPASGGAAGLNDRAAECKLCAALG